MRRELLREGLHRRQAGDVTPAATPADVPPVDTEEQRVIHNFIPHQKPNIQFELLHEQSVLRLSEIKLAVQVEVFEHGILAAEVLCRRIPLESGALQVKALVDNKVGIGDVVHNHKVNFLRLELFYTMHSVNTNKVCIPISERVLIVCWKNSTQEVAFVLRHRFNDERQIVRVEEER